MEVIVNVKVKVNTSNPHATPHSIGETLKYQINTISEHADGEVNVVDWNLDCVHAQNATKFARKQSIGMLILLGP